MDIFNEVDHNLSLFDYVEPFESGNDVNEHETDISSIRKINLNNPDTKNREKFLQKIRDAIKRKKEKNNIL